MGYTHYMARAAEDESYIKAWPQMVEDARKIAAHCQKKGVELAGGFGEGVPEFSEKWIWLNGVGPDDDHETLLIDANPALRLEQEKREVVSADSGSATGYRLWYDSRIEEIRRKGFEWSFCKTARKPYDVVVGAILLRCAQLAPDAFVIDSDGSWEDEWFHGGMFWGDGGERSILSARHFVRELFGSDECPPSSGLVGGDSSTEGPPCAKVRQ